MSPSPTLAETQRMPMVSAVSTMATSAATSDSPMISRLSCCSMPLLMMERNSRGLMTPTTASMVTSTRKKMRMFR